MASAFQRASRMQQEPMVTKAATTGSNTMQATMSII